ncbi:MAG: hypothetical protein DSY77_00995 [Bacteroidetes bacterium]|nr:MAG: hypothetical protein DSY77_00995 [Bacteroidota bacterium]
MKRYLILFTCLISFIAFGCSNEPKELLPQFKTAIEAADEDIMKELIIQDEKISSEHAEALASIYIDLLGKRFEKAMMENQDKIKMVDRKRLNSVMSRSMAFLMGRPDHLLENGEPTTFNGGNYIVLEEKGKKMTLMLKEESGQTKFWPMQIQPNDDLIEFAQFLSDYRKTLVSSNQEDFPKAFDELVNKYVKGTSLAFVKQPLEVKIKGEVVPVNSVVVTQEQNIKGQEVLRLNFLKADEVEKCGKYQPKAFSVDLPVNDQNVYDFSLLGINGSLQETNLSISVMDGKVELIKIDENTYSGQIAAEKDKKNSIYGTFEAKVCK